MSLVEECCVVGLGRGFFFCYRQKGKINCPIGDESFPAISRPPDMECGLGVPAFRSDINILISISKCSYIALRVNRHNPISTVKPEITETAEFRILLK